MFAVPVVDLCQQTIFHLHAGACGFDVESGLDLVHAGLEPFTVGPREQACTVTRGRPYQHNDNAHNEQRNGDWVRKHAFRHRYETDAELALLNQLWALVMARKNHLLPA